MTNTVFYYVDAPIGSGKSYALGQHLKSATNPVTIGTQTNALSIQYEHDLTKLWLSAKAIFRADKDDSNDDIAEDNDDREGSAKRYKQGCNADFPILIANQDVVGRCKENTASRDLFNDEITVVYERLQIDGLPLSQQIVADYFEAIDDSDSEFVRLRRSKRIVDASVDGWQDKLLRNADSSIKKVFMRLSDPDFAVLVSREDLLNFKRELRGWLGFHVLMMPSRFDHYRSVTFIGANFKDSLLYLIWRNLVDFKPHPQITAQYHDIRDKAHLVDLYAFHERDLSSSLLNETGRQKYYDACQMSAAPIIGEKPSIYCMNNERRGERHIWSVPNAERLSPDPRGINKFQDRHVAVHLAALNEHPETFGFLDRFAHITPEQVKRATTWERIGQFIGRISIRSKLATERVLIFVSDLAAATYLQGKIGCSMPIVLGVDLETVQAAPKKRGPKKKVERSDVQQREYEKLRKREQRRKSRELPIAMQMDEI